MTAPLSQTRIYQAIKHLMPSGRAAWKEDGSSILKELSVAAYALGIAADLVEQLLDELMPDTTRILMPRMLATLQVDIKPNDTLDAQRARLLARLRRQVGYTPALLARALALPFDLSADQVQFVEVTRQQIDDALTFVDPLISQVLPGPSTPLIRLIGSPWPGGVDDEGVKVSLTFSAWSGTQSMGFILRHADGTVYTGGVSGTAPGGQLDWEDRSTFTAKPAAGPWTFSIYDVGGSGAITLSRLAVRVSNDIDALQIYNFFAYRDPSLSGTPDITAAQQLFRRTALGHVLKLVCQRLGAIFDDPLSLVDREPIGA